MVALVRHRLQSGSTIVRRALARILSAYLGPDDPAAVNHLARLCTHGEAFQRPFRFRAMLLGFEVRNGGEALRVHAPREIAEELAAALHHMRHWVARYPTAARWTRSGKRAWR